MILSIQHFIDNLDNCEWNSYVFKKASNVGKTTFQASMNHLEFIWSIWTQECFSIATKESRKIINFSLSSETFLSFALNWQITCFRDPDNRFVEVTSESQHAITDVEALCSRVYVLQHCYNASEDLLHRGRKKTVQCDFYITSLFRPLGEGEQWM